MNPFEYMQTLAELWSRSGNAFVAAQQNLFQDMTSRMAKAGDGGFAVPGPMPDAVTEIREATKGGVEFAFEMAGSVRAMDLAYKITRRGGTTVTAGLPPPTHTFALPQVNLVAEERTVKGSYIGTCVPTRDLPRYIELYRRGKLPVDRLMSDHLRLDDINEGFDRLHEGKAVRQVVLT